MTETTFKEKIYNPLVQKLAEELHFYISENKENIAATLFQTLNIIGNELPIINLPNAKYITFSLLRTHLLESGEFLYSAKVFDENFLVSKELNENCCYNAYWLAKEFEIFSNSLEDYVSKSMMKHKRTYVIKLISQVAEDLNIYFVHTAKNLLNDYNNASLKGFSVLSGDYIFSQQCLTRSKFEKILEVKDECRN